MFLGLPARTTMHATLSTTTEWLGKAVGQSWRMRPAQGWRAWVWVFAQGEGGREVHGAGPQARQQGQVGEPAPWLQALM